MPEKGRRKLLKGISVTLPAVWLTPVVESVILPAHAGTSQGGGGCAYGSAKEAADALCSGEPAQNQEDCIECEKEFQAAGCADLFTFDC